MIIERLVQGSRLARARSIQNKDVVEFCKVKTEPLVVYCRIQGSDITPYTAIIDLEEGVVGHWCPDFFKGEGWCKHLGKLLLMLTDQEVTTIANAASTLRHVKAKESMAEMLSRIKSVLVENAVKTNQNRTDEQASTETNQDASIEPGEIVNEGMGTRGSCNASMPAITLADMINVLCANMQDGKECPDLALTVKHGIAEDLESMDGFLALFQIESIIVKIPAQVKAQFVEQCKDVFQEKLGALIGVFYDHFWSMSNLKRLEIAAVVHSIATDIGFQLTLDGLSRPATFTGPNAMDARLALEMLLGNEHQETFDNAIVEWELPDHDDENRLHRMYLDMNVSGTHVQQVKNWIAEKIGEKAFNLPSFAHADDLLIYIETVAGERPKFNPWAAHPKPSKTYKARMYYGSREYVQFPQTMLETNPALKFVMERIKSSGREYITTPEMEAHKHFFSWLSGNNIVSTWVERTRTREPDFKIEGGGNIIIQWDINVSRPQQPFLQAFDGSKRLTINRTCPLISRIQPFDCTLCHSEMLSQPDRSVAVQPTVVLVADQVVDLILRGVPIISNILPWNVLSNFARTGNVSGGAVALAIDTCKKYRYIYGDVDLQRTLERLSKLGKQGMQANAYAELRDKTKTLSKSARLSVAKREACRDLLAAESPFLDTLLEAARLDENNRYKIVLNALRFGSTIEAFRDIVSKDIAAVILKNPIDKDTFNSIKAEKLGPYYMAPVMIAEKMKSALAIIKKKVEKSRAMSRELLWVDPVAQVVAAVSNIPQKGSLTEDELARILETIERLCA
ncbi:MAG TPA: hypothetical protein VKM55_19255 [Candidatus Lokiarchaeia archaeon]|nr:hypothetical protein [Candidatus Lokiarchaeia archaeon]